MLEQTTIREGIHLASEWGWIGTAIVLYILSQTVYAVYSNMVVKRKAFDPLSKIIKELGDKASFEWTEKKLEKYQMKEVAEAHLRGLEIRLLHIEKILQEINSKIK